MDFKEFDSIRIGLASPEMVREWSYGEVKKPETINYRTLKPEREGLFCEQIFGPQKDWECHCGKYKRIRYKGKICEKCGVEVTKAKVRRERMGHIELAAPVSHIWYFKGNPSRIGTILDITSRYLERVLYFASYIVTDPGFTSLSEGQLLSEREYREMRERYGEEFRASMGAEAIKELLEKIDIDELSDKLKKEIDESAGQKRIRLMRRLEVVDAFKNSGNKPEWMIMDVVPVIPPDIRPMVQLDGGRFATSDLNDLYRRVINRNNRLKKLLELSAPDIIVRNEKRMLQESVDALIDNGRRGRPVTGPSNRPFKSLSDMLKGKQGRFRQNLLGKRVDYSGRSVIVVGPELKMHQCGLPKEMALELFKPFVMKDLVERGFANNIKSSKKKVERAHPEVWDSLERVIKGHPVLLNRAPTLHRLGIQAFEPVLVEGRALKLHPLVCTAYNADFDGDQMAVHVPLSLEAQREAKELMLASRNLLKPSDGKPVAVPTQDMVLGSYYLTMVNDADKGEGNVYRDENEAIMAYQEGVVSLHAKIRVRREINGVTKLVDTTAGKIIFNQPIPQDLGFVDRTDSEEKFKYEIDFLVNKSKLGKIIERCIKIHGADTTALVLDRIKAQGFRYSTKGAVTVAIADAIIPPQKAQLLEDAEKQIGETIKNFNKGLISNEERYQSIIDTWNETTEKVSDAITQNLNDRNPIYMMADSGARGSINQIRQLAGMRGLIANTAGKTIEIPIRANYREGLNVLEYFISSRGARKGLADTALRTADSGYLTRRLVDVSQDVIVREEDCETTFGITVSDIKDGNEMIEPLTERLQGRYLTEDLMHPETGKLLCSSDYLIDATMAEKIVEAGVTKTVIRSVLACRAKVGCCAKCYGNSLATGERINIGEAVGIIAAQSIGEPGTQLTMRTFHTGGIANADDITQGLPRVEELFEARRPKALAIMSEIDGVVSIDDTKKNRYAVVKGKDADGVDIEMSYMIPFGQRLKVTDGEVLEKGDMITEGHAYPQDILAIKGAVAVQNYLIQEVQRVYRMQGVDINDKHIEVIVRQMMRRVKVEDPGKTTLIAGATIDRNEFELQNAFVRTYTNENEHDAACATCSSTLLGITKASLATDSFLSAASFQETTKVLTDAAIRGKVDPLTGLKENVIIGKIIPAGTGLNK